VKPLQAIAMGFVIIALGVSSGYDPLPDPIGWLLVLVGVRGLPRDWDLWPALLGVGVLAGVVSIPLWVPAFVDELDRTDESIQWVANLPQFAFYALLALALTYAAAAARERRATTWWRLTFGLALVVVAVPVLIFGGGLGLESLGAFCVDTLRILVIVLLFVYAGRPWAGAPPPADPQDSAPA
jgi:hypothetical protein